jgi:tetratricopeptide (TPR) repeat protein
LDRDYDNVRSALEWSQTTAGDPEAALRLAVALSSLGHYGDIRHEAIATLQRALDHPLSVGRTFAHAQARVELALHLSRTGNYGAAQAQNQQALSLLRELGDSWLHPLILSRLSGLACIQGDSATAWAWLCEGIAIYRQHEDTAGLAWALIRLASVAILDEDPARAEALLAESHAVWPYDAYMESSFTSLWVAWRLNTLVGRRGTAAPVDWVPAPAARATYKRGMAAAHAQLGEEAFAAAWAAGRAISLEQAIAYALEGSAVDSVSSSGL